MLVLRPFEDLAAAAVLRALDPHDQIEAELVTRRAAASVKAGTRMEDAQGTNTASPRAHRDQGKVCVHSWTAGA